MMKVIMFSWEYPPKRVGGIAAALEGLCPAVAKQNIEVHVITSGDAGGEADEEQAKNLFIHRVPAPENSNDFIHWVHGLNDAMAEKARELITGWQKSKAKSKKKDEIVLHVHDWLGLFAGRTIKHEFKLPLVSTIHATEYGRNNGIHTDTNRYINQCEWDLQWESWRVIVCTGFMKGEVEYALRTPSEKIDIIYNGIESAKFDFDFPEDEKAAFRKRFAEPDEKIIYFIGRMVHEKGAQILIEALKYVKMAWPKTKLIIAGGGPRAHLETLAHQHGLWEAIYFTGRISDEDRDKLYRVADMASYPSLYEPFGIVALEAMAAGVPVVVSDAGGLSEVVQHDLSGTVTFAGDATSLAWGLLRVLREPEQSQWMAENAKTRCKEVFSWDLIATQTIEVYKQVWGEFVISDFVK
jgi:glycogen synthase